MSRKCWHEAPFDKNGDQTTYPDWPGEMRPVEPFDDTLEFVDFERGRSAANAVMRRTSGNLVRLFLTDFEPLVASLQSGRMTGRWIYVKRGANYGVALDREPQR